MLLVDQFRAEKGETEPVIAPTIGPYSVIICVPLYPCWPG